MFADFCRRRSWSSDRVPLFEYRSFFVDWGNANVRSPSLILFDSSSPVCCAVNYVRSAANFAAANWGRVHVSMYVNDQGGLYICRFCPPVHNESSAQEERNPSTQSPIIDYSSLRSRRPGIGWRNLVLTLQQVLGFAKVSFAVYFT